MPSLKYRKLWMLWTPFKPRESKLPSQTLTPLDCFLPAETIGRTLAHWPLRRCSNVWSGTFWRSPSLSAPSRCANSVAFASVLRMSPCAIWWTTGAHVSLWRAEKSELPSSNLSAECVRNCCVCEEPLLLSTNQTFAMCALATSCLPDPFFLSLCI